MSEKKAKPILIFISRSILLASEMEIRTLGKDVPQNLFSLRVIVFGLMLSVSVIKSDEQKLEYVLFVTAILLKNNWQSFASVMIMPLVGYMAKHWARNEFLITSFLCHIFEKNPDVQSLAPNMYKTSSGRLSLPKNNELVSLIFSELQKHAMCLDNGQVNASQMNIHILLI